MGFPDDFKIVVNNTQIYRQSGNSIVVNVLENIMKEICKSMDWEYE
jgi:DNA (cytosine-5)-methyltransferase 1